MENVFFPIPNQIPKYQNIKISKCQNTKCKEAYKVLNHPVMARNNNKTLNNKKCPNISYQTGLVDEWFTLLRKERNKLGLSCAKLRRSWGELSQIYLLSYFIYFKI